MDEKKLTDDLKCNSYKTSWKAKFFKAEAEIERLTEERNEYKGLYETMYRKWSDLSDKEFNCDALRKEKNEYFDKAVELQKQVDELKEDIAEKDSVIDNLIKERPSIEKYAVKDTAKEIYDDFMKRFDLSVVVVKEEVQMYFADNFGVEVE